MFERLNPGDFRRLRVCERTNLLLVEFNTVSCSSQSTMEGGGTWTGQGYSTPWMYHSVAGQYTLLEKQLVPDVSPYRHRPVLRVLQDSTNWHNAQPTPHWGLLKQEGQWFSGKDLSRATSSPKAQRQLPLPLQPQCSPTYEGLRPICRRDGSWGALGNPGRDGPTGFLSDGSFVAAAPSCRWYPGGINAKSRCDPPTRAPPSYEAHMLLRLRAGQGPRKENWPHPPPYVAPPSYEAPHRTVQPQSQSQQQPPSRQCPYKETLIGKQVLTVGPKKCGDRGTCEAGGPLSHGPGRKVGRRQAKIPGSWSYLSGASTWGGPRRQPERSRSAYGLEPSWDMSPQHRSHTLPRISKRNQGVPVPSPPQHTLPAGWGFSHAVGWPPGAVGNGGSRAGEKHGKDLLPKWKEPSHTRQPGGSRGSWPKLAPQRCGGLFVIDATCVVIQAHYIPPPRTEHVRYLGQEGLGKVKAALSPGSPAPVSIEERAARILGLSVSELGFTEAGKGKILGPGIPGPKASEGFAAEASVPQDVYGTGQPRTAPSTPASPRKPLPTPAPQGFQAEPPQQGLPCPEETETSTVLCEESGCGPPQGEQGPEPVLSPESRPYALDLKEAMSRIRRHTAPDSDTDEELEKECQPVCGRPVEWRGRMNEGALSYSSSSLDSSGSNATVVPGNATPTLRNPSEEPPVGERGQVGPGSAVTVQTN